MYSGNELLRRTRGGVWHAAGFCRGMCGPCTCYDNSETQSALISCLYLYCVTKKFNIKFLPSLPSLLSLSSFLPVFPSLPSSSTLSPSSPLSPLPLPLSLPLNPSPPPLPPSLPHHQVLSPNAIAVKTPVSPRPGEVDITLVFKNSQFCINSPGKFLYVGESCVGIMEGV